jgi:hypothetical protein
MHMLPTQLDLIADAEELILDIRDQSGDPAYRARHPQSLARRRRRQDEDMGACIHFDDQLRTAFPIAP